VSFRKFARTFFGGCRRVSALPPGKSAPAISLDTIDGKKATLAEALSKGPVLAAFFKVSCPTCQFTFPFLERMYEMFGGENFTFWAISQNDAEDTRGFLEKYGVQFPALLDEKGYPASNQFGLTNVPTTFLIGQDGKIRITSVGFSKADLERMAAEAARATGKLAAALFRPSEAIPEYKPG
jgi:cytochrome c biogenesis protein CcmG/thiol:disulfide interchange protein DsbE